MILEALDCIRPQNNHGSEMTKSTHNVPDLHNANENEKLVKKSWPCIHL